MAMALQTPEIFSVGYQNDLKTAPVVDVQALSDLSSEEDFSEFATKTVTTTVDPQFSVDGFQIAQPLSEEDARLCIHLGHHTPVGRRVWELKSADFQIGNPDFANHVEEVATAAVAEMSFAQEHAGFRVELSNVYFYEDDAVVEAQDINNPDVFARLNVQLPSSREAEQGSRFVLAYNLVEKELRARI